MKRFLFLLLLSGCATHSSTDTAAVVTDTQLLAMTGENLPIRDESTRLTEEDRKRLHRYYPKTLEKIDKSQPLSLQDIKNLTRSGITDSAIIYEIKATRSLFYLTPDDEKELEQAGVSKRVVQEMKDTSDTSY